MMRTLLILTAIIGLSASVFAQTAAPKGGKPVKQPKPSAPMGCKLVGTVKGTKLLDKRKPDPERRAAVNLISCRYEPVVRFNHGARDGQPHAHAFRLAGEKRFEDLF